MDMKKLVECLSESEKVELLALLTNTAKETENGMIFKDDSSLEDKLNMISMYLEIYGSEDEFAINFAKTFERYSVRILKDCSKGGNFYVSFIRHFGNRIEYMVRKNPESNILTWMGFVQKEMLVKGQKDISDEEFDMYTMYPITSDTERKGIISEIEYHPYILSIDANIYFKGHALIE